MPFFCYNKDDYCDHSESCDGCDVWVRGKGGKEVPSNGDRIRAMSDKELEWAIDPAIVPPGMTRREWLKQPAKEVHADG